MAHKAESFKVNDEKQTIIIYSNVEVPAGGMSEITVPVISSLSGEKDLYFVFSGQLEFDWWSFS